MIRLHNVHKAFGPKRVLQGFTLDVEEGETMVIIGYSGTGKSVAIKHIVGLLEPDAGEVWVDGLEVPALPRRELYKLRARIGYVFQFAALFDSFTIGDNVAMALRKQGELTEAEIQERVAQALAEGIGAHVADVRRRLPAATASPKSRTLHLPRAKTPPRQGLSREPGDGIIPASGGGRHVPAARKPRAKGENTP